MKKKKKL